LIDAVYILLLIERCQTLRIMFQAVLGRLFVSSFGRIYNGAAMESKLPRERQQKSDLLELPIAQNDQEQNVCTQSVEIIREGRDLKSNHRSEQMRLLYKAIVNFREVAVDRRCTLPQSNHLDLSELEDTWFEERCTADLGPDGFTAAGRSSGEVALVLRNLQEELLVLHPACRHHEFTGTDCVDAWIQAFELRENAVFPEGFLAFIEMAREV
jgi:hypothetical protein